MGTFTAILTALMITVVFIAAVPQFFFCYDFMLDILQSTVKFIIKLFRKNDQKDVKNDSDYYLYTYKDKRSKMRYNSLKEADQANFNLLKDIYGNDKDWQLIEAPTNTEPYDGILIRQIDNQRLVCLIEVKMREFDHKKLVNCYDGKFFLEKSKARRMLKAKKEIERDGITVKCFYLNQTSDGTAYLFDITDREYQYLERLMPNQSYSTGGKQLIKTKEVALLSIHSAECVFTPRAIEIKDAFLKERYSGFKQWI